MVFNVPTHSFGYGNALVQGSDPIETGPNSVYQPGMRGLRGLASLGDLSVQDRIYNLATAFGATACSDLVDWDCNWVPIWSSVSDKCKAQLAAKGQCVQSANTQPVPEGGVHVPPPSGWESGYVSPEQQTANMNEAFRKYQADIQARIDAIAAAQNPASYLPPEEEQTGTSKIFVYGTIGLLVFMAMSKAVRG